MNTGQNPELVFCPNCQEEGQKSRVYSQGMSHTAMSVTKYWDEDGHPHLHDANKVREMFSCSRGHVWTRNVPNRCPYCPWVQEVA